MSSQDVGSGPEPSRVGWFQMSQAQGFLCLHWGQKRYPAHDHYELMISMSGLTHGGGAPDFYSPASVSLLFPVLRLAVSLSHHLD